MCNFFSCVSDGNGKILYFSVSQVARECANGNPENYDWNSHTSIMFYHGIKNEDSHLWNKWEYDPLKQTLRLDYLATNDDREVVLKKMKELFRKKDISFMDNLYRDNWDRNTGYRNSGDRNTGNQNSGDRNSGNWNSGHWNTGNWNSGIGNSGIGNSDNCNTGDYNTGVRNSGNWNSGDYNTGNWNSGNRNTGYFNSLTSNRLTAFNKEVDLKEWEKAEIPNFCYFDVNKWIPSSMMTDEEKENHPTHEVIGGYLKEPTYKEAFIASWEKAPIEDREKIKLLPNFDKNVFLEISGIDVEGMGETPNLFKKEKDYEKRIQK